MVVKACPEARADACIVPVGAGEGHRTGATKSKQRSAHMKTNTNQRLVLLLALLAAAGIASSALAGHVEAAKPQKPPPDADCWLSEVCSIPRGGNADVLTIYTPDGTVLTQIFAFGQDEDGHLYYFDRKVVPVDMERFGHYTALLESDGSWSEALGIFKVRDNSGHSGKEDRYVLGFTSDPLLARNAAGLPDMVYLEAADLRNPVPLTSGEGDYLSVPYDATRFLSKEWQAQGYKAEFRTATEVPEPGALGLVGLGLTGVMVAHHGKEHAEPLPPSDRAAALGAA